MLLNANAAPFACALGLLAMPLLRTLYQFITSFTSGIPGPILARVSRPWLFYEAYRGSLHLPLIDLHSKWGPVIRITPGQYSIDDPSAIPIVYGPGKAFIKWYEAGGNPKSKSPTLFVERDPHMHSNFRWKVSAAYSMTNLVSLESHPASEYMLEFARTGAVLDIPHWTQCYAFDVIGMVTVSFPNRLLEKITRIDFFRNDRVRPYRS